MLDSVIVHTYLHLQGTQVWLPDKQQVWVCGEVLSSHVTEVLTLRVKGEGSEERGEPLLIKVTSKAEFPPLKNPQLLVGANDLTSLSYLHEPAGEVVSLQ